ncbi:MAG: phosphotransferase family protein [Eubacteriales bacterium]
MERRNPSYRVHLPELFRSLGMDVPLLKVQPLTGGHLHRMYAVTCADGRKFAVKALNPGVMARPEAMRNFMVSEAIAALAAQEIPAVAALTFGENKAAVQECGGQDYLIYDFVEGESLFFERISEESCAKMGQILAKLHRLDVSSVVFPEDVVPPVPALERDWELGQPQGTVWDNDANRLDKLYEWDRRYAAAREAASRTVVSHRDLEPKNVLWYRGEPRLIDWEAAGRVDPWYDLFENAVYWSKNRDGTANEEKFKSFLYGYFTERGEPPDADIDWSLAADAGFGLLDWLEYNLKRSFGIECADAAEQRLGAEQVTETLRILERYDASVPTMTKWARQAIECIGEKG